MSAEIFNGKTTLVVRYRLISDFNICVAISAAFALFMIGLAVFQPLKSSEIAPFVLTLGLTITAPLYWLIARIRGAIILDESGVRWRTAFSGWKSANWEEIESWDLRATSTTTQWKFVVSTRHGAFSWTKSFQNSEQWAPFAARFCPTIPAEIEKWPRVYNYRSAENWMMPPIAFPALGFWLVWSFWKLFSSSPRDWMEQISINAATSGWPFTLFTLLAFVCFMMVLPSVMLLLYWRIWTQSFTRRDEQFSANPDGLTCQRAQQQPFSVAWPELQKLHIEARGFIGLPQYRLETARGEFSWNNGLNGWAQFHQTLRESAPQLQEITAPRLKSSLLEVPIAAAKTQIFDFKTRELRAMLLLMVFASLMLLGFSIFGAPVGRHEPAPQWVCVLGFVVSSAVTGYGLALFRRGAIQVDDRGIEWKIPLRKRFVAWEEIEELILEREAFLRVGAQKVPLNGAPLPPAHFDIFLKTVRNHLNRE